MPNELIIQPIIHITHVIPDIEFEEMNQKYRLELGNYIFKISVEGFDNPPIFVAAKNIMQNPRRKSFSKTGIELLEYCHDLDWLYVFQGFFLGGVYPVPNEPIIQPISHLTHVIPLQGFLDFICTYKKYKMFTCYCTNHDWAG